MSSAKRNYSETISFGTHGLSHKRLLTLIVILGLLTGSCKPRSNANPGLAKDSTKDFMADVFSDFAYAGSGVYEETRVPPHEIISLPFPTSLTRGYAYVFHHSLPTNNDVVFEKLKTRLATYGAQVQTSSGSTRRMIGGLAFRINFQTKEYKGFIFNQTDELLARSHGLPAKWMLDDYFLVIEQSSGLATKQTE